MNEQPSDGVAPQVPETPVQTYLTDLDRGRVEALAYALYLVRAGGPGTPEQDWVDAERQARDQVSRGVAREQGVGNHMSA